MSTKIYATSFEHFPKYLLFWKVTLELFFLKIFPKTRFDEKKEKKIGKFPQPIALLWEFLQKYIFFNFQIKLLYWKLSTQLIFWTIYKTKLAFL